jgi:hypothetical protein
MARVAIEGDELVVRLRWLEKLGAFRSNVRVPLAAIRDVRVATHPWAELRGIRAPGTGFPGLISLGTRRGRSGKDFAAVYRRTAAVVIELEGAGFRRLVVSAADPEGMAARVARSS